MTFSTIQWVGIILFIGALIHTFSTKYFERLARVQPRHAKLWHLLAEVELVFGFWASLLILMMIAINGLHYGIDYLHSCRFTEPLFIFVIMIVAATRPILNTATTCASIIAKLIPLRGSLALYFILLTFTPLLGSIITEPAAMTLAALLLGEHFYKRNISLPLKYLTLGVLFVNISIGGTLSSFAAPPVLMVASQWHWNTQAMFLMFGWKALIAILINALAASLLFRKELRLLSPSNITKVNVPLGLTLAHVAFLAAIILFGHYPVLFIGLFLLFLGMTQAYSHYQSRLIIRESLLVTVFLAGLVILGNQQQWWLAPLLTHMNHNQAFIGATILTAFTDNAALTYLGSLVEGLSHDFKYALVAGAVTGGGLTIIANAPNPAGVAILRSYFDKESIQPLKLLCAALIPTIVAALAFKYL